MEIKNPLHLETAQTLAKMCKYGRYDEAFNQMSYLTGLYGVYFGVVVLCLLDKENAEKFVEALCKKCDIVFK